MNENIPNPPQPENPLPPIGEPEPVKPEEGKRIVSRVAKIVLFTVGGMMAFASVTTPRCAGATRSAKLHQLQREQEIQRVIQSEMPNKQPEGLPEISRGS